PTSRHAPLSLHAALPIYVRGGLSGDLSAFDDGLVSDLRSFGLLVAIGIRISFIVLAVSGGVSFRVLGVGVSVGIGLIVLRIGVSVGLRLITVSTGIVRGLDRHGESSSVRGPSVDTRHGLRIVLALSAGAFEGEVTAVIGFRRGFAVFGARPGDLDVSTGSRLARDRSLGLDRLVLDLRCRRGFGLIAGFFEVEVRAGLLERVVEVGDSAEFERSAIIPLGRSAT